MTEQYQVRTKNDVISLTTIYVAHITEDSVTLRDGRKITKNRPGKWRIFGSIPGAKEYMLVKLEEQNKKMLHAIEQNNALMETLKS